MLTRVVFHLGTAGDGLSTRLAWAKGKDVLAERGLCHPDPHMDFGSLREILERNPEARTGILPLNEAFLKEYCAYLQNTADRDAAYVLYFNFWSSFFWLSPLPLLRAMLQNAFPQAEIKAFVSLARQDVTLEAYYAATHFRGSTPAAASWLEGQRRSPAYNYSTCLKNIFSVFGKNNVECFVSSPVSDTPEDIRHASLLAQEAFWRYAGVNVTPDPETGLACFQPCLELCLPPEFYAFCRCYNAMQSNSRQAFVSPLAEQSVRFAGWTPLYSPFSPKERAAFVAANEVDNARTAALLGRDRLFNPVDETQAWEPFPGLTEESAFKVASRLEPDFARARMAEFDATPVHYLDREQRIVRQALRDVLDPPSATPLIRPRREEPKLSVLTASYNQAAYIAECIESVLAQQINFPFQHIIADDGSDDGTQDIILDYAAKYPHIVPVFQKKRSYGSKNLRALFDMARTEYVAICEGDDYFTDTAKLQTQVDFLEANPHCGLCFHVARVIYEGDPESEHLYPVEASLPGGMRPFYYLTDVIRKNFIQTNSVMYRWRFKNGLPDWFRTDLMPADWYWHVLHAEKGKVGFINKVMSVYRRHKKGIYYLAAADKLKHRAKTGMKEIEVFDVVNKHFNRVYEPILLELADNVFANCAVYDETQAKEEGLEPVLPEMCKKYPEMAWHFLQSLKNVPQ